MGLHIAILAAAARGIRKRHGNDRAQRRLRPIKPNHKAELVYRAGLLQLVGRCRKLIDESIGQLKVYWPKPVTEDGIRVSDSVPMSAKQMIEKSKKKLGNLDEWAKRMAKVAANTNADNVDKNLSREINRAIGVNVGHILRANGPLLKSMTLATKTNVALIKTIPSQYFDRVYKTVMDTWTGGQRWEFMVEKLQRDHDITENRAKLIARDQTAKMNSAFNQERQQQVGIERYEWSTSQDERVRGNPNGKYPDADPSHYDYERQDNGWGPGVFSWSDPPEGGHPGDDINCRCVAIPVVDMGALENEISEAA